MVDRLLGVDMLSLARLVRPFIWPSRMKAYTRRAFGHKRRLNPCFHRFESLCPCRTRDQKPRLLELVKLAPDKSERDGLLISRFRDFEFESPNQNLAVRMTMAE